MPIAPAGSYEITPSKLTAKLTSNAAAAAEVVAQVVSMTPSGSERDIEEQAYIGLDAKRQMIKGKGGETLEMTLKAISPDFEAMCKQSWDNPGVTLTLAVISKGINFRGTEADNITRTQTFVGVVTKRLEVSEYVAGEPAEFQLTIALSSEPVTTVVSP